MSISVPVPLVPFPDLPGIVHGIISLDPPRVQCDGCGKVVEGTHLGLTILTSGIEFRRGHPGRRMCASCWESIGVSS